VVYKESWGELFSNNLNGSNMKGFLYTISYKDFVTDKTGDISATFRSRKPEIDRKLKVIQDELKDRSSHQKKSVNQVLNFSVNLAHEFIQDHREIVKDIDIEIKELNKEKENQRKIFNRALEF